MLGLREFRVRAKPRGIFLALCSRAGKQNGDEGDCSQPSACRPPARSEIHLDRATTMPSFRFQNARCSSGDHTGFLAERFCLAERMGDRNDQRFAHLSFRCLSKCDRQTLTSFELTARGELELRQFSPRVSVVYKPFDGTALHAGYARYFTPPAQVLAGPTNVAAFDNTTQASQTCGGQSPVVQPPCGAVLPERSHYFDVGIVQSVLPGLDIGVDGYYKLARDLLDDGQFGAALVLDGFNYAKGKNKAVEVKTNYSGGNFKAYRNVTLRTGRQRPGLEPIPVQPRRHRLHRRHYIFTDHSQTLPRRLA